MCHCFAAHTECTGHIKKRAGAEPISRVLSRATISLGRRLPAASSNLPGSGGGPDRPAPRQFPGSSLFGLAPSGVCPARTVTRSAVRSYRTFSPLPGGREGDFRRTRQPHGGLFSVALSRSSRMVGVTHHCVLWSPDFPRSGWHRRLPVQLRPRSLGSLRPIAIVRPLIASSPAVASISPNSI